MTPIKSNKAAMTLDRVLSRFGVASRTDAEGIIRAGRVKLNGRVVRDPALWVRPDEDSVHLDGKRLRPARRLYLLLYKPKGVVTSHGDPSGRKTVYDLLGDSARWVTPVGRLDRDTSGLLLLTNDTDFANFVTSPESKVPKTYILKLDGLIPEGKLSELRQGVRMKRGDWAHPESVTRLEDRGKHSWLEVTLAEGKNREVRRMVEAVGFKVLKLVRTRLGPLTLENLQVGHYRELTHSEISAIKSSAGASPASSHQQPQGILTTTLAVPVTPLPSLARRPTTCSPVDSSGV